MLINNLLDLLHLDVSLSGWILAGLLVCSSIAIQLDHLVMIVASHILRVYNLNDLPWGGVVNLHRMVRMLLHHWLLLLLLKCQ